MTMIHMDKVKTQRKLGVQTLAKVGDSHYTNMVSLSFFLPLPHAELHKNYNSVSSTATVNSNNNIALTVS